jgi:putative glutamine amidotransferase
MGRRPLIGISASEIREAQTIRRVREDEPPGHEFVLGTSYVSATVAAGGMPVMIPPLDPPHVHELLDECLDGVCLTGGPDIDPVFYGAEPDPNLGPTKAEFDAFELTLSRGAVERGVPLLAICRGIQVLNVSLGGSLIQHLPDHSPLSHRQDEPGHVPGHPITVAPESRLATLIGATDIEVNTYHHQAIETLGSGLVPVARAADGIIEAVEGAGDDFVFGVQWHAELMAPRDIEARLFAGLVDAASARGQKQIEKVAR